MKESQYLCEICKENFNTLKKLIKHVHDKHLLSSKDYYDKYLAKENDGLCKICGKPTRYVNCRRGYFETCSHKCHAKLQSIMCDTDAKRLINDKRKNTWLQKSTEEMDAYKKLQHHIQTQRHQNMSIEEKEQISKNIKNKQQKMSPHKKFIRRLKISINLKSFLKNCSNDIKVLRNEAISIGLKNYYNTLSENEYNKIITNFKHRISSSQKDVNKKRMQYEKMSATFKSKTKDEWAAITQKQINTKIKNNSLNISKLENKCYEQLLTKFKTYDIKRQYKSKEYPFYCDFYIISLNLYIECHFHWTHGAKLFDSNNLNDINTLNNWKNKNSMYYKNAIYVWTTLDIKKYNLAKQNNLNYLLFYNITEFNTWLSTI